MKKHYLIILLLLCTSVVTMGQNWDDIVYSGEYYYGEGYGKTRDEARESAMSDLTSKIVVNVKSDFSLLIDETNTNGKIEHETRVKNVIKSYSQMTLSNVRQFSNSLGDDGEYYARYYMKCDEMKKIFEGRINKAKGFFRRAEGNLQSNKVEMALRQYYWGYMLLCSLQYPNEVRDENGNLLIVEVPSRIREILSDIDVEFLSRKGDDVDLKFTYKGKKIPSLKFHYNDGGCNCSGDMKDGIGTLQMATGYETEYYHVEIEYTYEGEAGDDQEIQSLFSAVPRGVYNEAYKRVKGKEIVEEVAAQSEAQLVAFSENVLKPVPEAQFVVDTVKYKKVIDKLLGAIRTKNYYDVCDYFTIDGLDVYEKLIAYGSARVVGVPQIQFFKGADGCAVARGLQMSFSFRDNKGVKKTFVEDMVFYFDKEGKVDNISFGLGFEATNELLSREDEENGWKHDVLAVFLEFLENYKTAYCLERLDYIKSIFSDDAVIIVGKILEKKNTVVDENQPAISVSSPQVTYDKQNKETYIKNLERVFRNNKFVNLKFQNLEVQKIYNDPTKERFAIKMFQEYSSSVYSDLGYLFLFLDMTNMDEPLIQIRTWQPNDIPLDKVIGISDFKFN